MLGTALRYLALLLTGVLSVAGSEALSIGALSNAPAGVDLTDVFFLALLLPSIAIVSLLAGILLRKVFVRLRWRGIIAYTVSYAAAYALFLNAVNNPPRDIATYLGIVLVVSPIVLGALDALFRKPTVVADVEPT